MFLRRRIGIAVNRQIQHGKVHQGMLNRRLISFPAARHRYARRALAVADRHGDRPLAAIMSPPQKIPRGRHQIRDRPSLRHPPPARCLECSAESALRLLPSASRCVGLQRFKPPVGRAALRVQFHHFDVRSEPEISLMLVSHLIRTPSLDRFVRFKCVRRHVRAIAPVDDERLVCARRRTCAPRPSPYFRRHRSPRAAEPRPLTGFHFPQQRHGVQHAHRIARRNIHVLSAPARWDENRIETSRGFSFSRSSTLWLTTMRTPMASIRAISRIRSARGSR